ncbi:RES family NAD+ phosphorylase [soil metagenome]
MQVWRLASGAYPPLTGEGARLADGRWHSGGRRVVYTSESLALATLECLVHLPVRLPARYVAFRIEVPEGEIESLAPGLLSPGWQQHRVETREIGNEWLDQQRSLALLVPSVVVPHGSNCLINPAHPAAERLRVLEQRPHRWDPRLRPPEPPA